MGLPQVPGPQRAAFISPWGGWGVFFLLMVAVRVWPLFLRPRGHIPAWRTGGLPGCPGHELG